MLHVKVATLESLEFFLGDKIVTHDETFFFFEKKYSGEFWKLCWSGSLGIKVQMLGDKL